MSDPILSIRGLRKTYGTGVDALKSVDLDIQRGRDFRAARAQRRRQDDADQHRLRDRHAERGRSAGRRQELAVATIAMRASGSALFRRNLRPKPSSRSGTPSASRAACYGKPRNDAFIEELLKRLSLWDKRKTIMMHLSGGMKRRVMIAKALSHEPDILFLDEPTAGVDVELRRDMWDLVRKLRADGTTIILTTHYIEEAEEMADRVGVISKGELIAVDEKTSLMAKMGKKTLDIMLAEPLESIPRRAFATGTSSSSDDGHMLRYQFDSHAERTGIASLMRRLTDLGIAYKDLSTHQSSLEDIFVELVHGGARMNFHGITAIYRFEMARWKRTLWQSLITPVITTALYFVVFGSALGSRHDEHGRGQLRRLHRARTDASVGLHAVDLQCKLRHLFSEVYGHNLRTTLSTDLELRGRARLCRRSGHQVRDPRARDARDRDAVRARPRRSSDRR